MPCLQRRADRGSRALFLMEQYRKRPASKRGSIWPALSGKTHYLRPTLLGSIWPPRDFAPVARHMMDFDSSPIPQVPKELSPSSHSGQTRLGGTAPNGEAALVAVLDLLADGSWKCPKIGQVPQPARRRDKTVARLSVPPFVGVSHASLSACSPETDQQPQSHRPVTINPIQSGASLRCPSRASSPCFCPAALPCPALPCPGPAMP